MLLLIQNQTHEQAGQRDVTSLANCRIYKLRLFEPIVFTAPTVFRAYV